MTSALIALYLTRFAIAQSYSATYLPTNAPNQTEQGQTGTNQCGTTVNQTSLCQNAYCKCSSSPFNFNINVKSNSEFCR
jgi:hypothetical protein